MKVCIAPYAARMPNDLPNPKNPPWWAELVAMLNAEGHEVIQLGVKGEPRIDGVGQCIQNFPLDKLINVIRDCDMWISVDSWLPHFCATMRLQSGIVIWAQSNPKIWGYKHNVNLLRDKAYLREYQYAHWWDCPYNADAFVTPATVMDALHGRLATAAT